MQQKGYRETTSVRFLHKKLRFTMRTDTRCLKSHARFQQFPFSLSLAPSAGSVVGTHFYEHRPYTNTGIRTFLVFPVNLNMFIIGFGEEKGNSDRKSPASTLTYTKESFSIVGHRARKYNTVETQMTTGETTDPMWTHLHS